MNPPLPTGAVAVEGEEVPGKIFECYLNRSGINTIEVPKEPVRADIGGRLCLKFLNRGAPVHITVTTTNAGMFTDFYHENLYVVDDTVLPILLKRGCQPGFFDIDILAGYGGSKAAIRVDVDRFSEREAEARAALLPVQPEAHGRPHLLMVAMGIALVLYASWVYTGIADLNTAAFIILIVGALYTWYRQG
ncbi:MAG: hypothetical protein PHF57_02295 [Methanoregula sp.]|jgi:hypothetical protein|nr:hypothetical protein [Methanoregula sp.]MDD5187018.1 hypothetical protein [Methanoregula sp.]